MCSSKGLRKQCLETVDFNTGKQLLLSVKVFSVLVMYMRLLYLFVNCTVRELFQLNSDLFTSQ